MKEKERDREKNRMKDCGPANVITLDENVYMGLSPHLYSISIANGTFQKKTNCYQPIQT